MVNTLKTGYYQTSVKTCSKIDAFEYNLTQCKKVIVPKTTEKHR